MSDIVYVWIVSLVVGIFILFLGASYFIRKVDDDTEDDLGYLELISLEKGGSSNE